MSYRDVSQAIDADTLDRAFSARLLAARLTGDQLVEEHRHNAARALFSAGLTLIPSDELHDHQFVVSRGVYDAARKITAPAPG